MQTPVDPTQGLGALLQEGVGASSSVEFRAGASGLGFTSKDLNRLQDEFLKGLDELSGLATLDRDPHRELLEQLPQYVKELRNAAGVEVSQRISDQAQGTTESLMEGASAMVSRLLAERAEYERDPNKALMEMLAPVAVLAATGGIAPEDLQMVLGLLAVSRDKIRQAKLAEYDDRVRTIQTGVLQWYRQYNLAKAQQNAPYVQMALESARMAGRMTKLSLDVAQRVFKNHLDLNNMRLRALLRGADFALRAARAAEQSFVEWWNTMIRLTRFVTTLDLDPTSQQTRRTLIMRFAEYTDALRKQYELHGIKSPIPQLTAQELQMMALTMNPEAALTISLTRRADADTRRLIALANNLDVQTQDVATRLVYRGLERYDEELIKSLREFAATDTTVESDNAANTIIMYAGMLTANAEAAAEAARRSGARVRGDAASSAAQSLAASAAIYLSSVVKHGVLRRNPSLNAFLNRIKNNIASGDMNQYNEAIRELREYRTSDETMSRHLFNLVRVLESTRESVGRIARAYAPPGNEVAEERAAQANYLAILAGAVRSQTDI